MNELEFRVRVQTALENLIFGFQANNNISYSILEDCLSKIMLTCKDRAYRECIDSILQAQATAVEDTEEEEGN